MALNQHVEISVSGLCKIASVSRSGYYKWLRSAPRVFDEIDNIINEFFIRKKCKVGYRTIKMYLERSCGLTVNHKRILSSMSLQGLKQLICRSRYKSVSMVESTLERAFSDKVKRGFLPSKPDSIYSGDITEFRIPGGLKIYLYAAKDLYTKEIISYNVGTSPNN